MERKLAAILAADVVGYSRLIAEDEARTLDALRALRRESFEPLVAEHRGEVVKRMGDGWLVSFASVVDAAQCAIQVQERLAGYDRIKLRIGVHLGDIVHEDEDIYGDGVNIAARLQEIAEPGGVLISGTSYESLVGRLDSHFEDAGEQTLKNVTRPIPTWRWCSAEPEAHIEKAIPAHSLSQEKPSVAVLAFENLSSDPENDFFGDGISEEIITTLSKVSSLFVIARNSSFAYKGKSIDLRQVGRELSVRYVLEGSVRAAGNRIRITAQLIDTETGRHVWADRYDRRVEDIFAVQDEITREIVTALRVKLSDGEQTQILLRDTDSVEAWGYAMPGLELVNLSTAESIPAGRALLERAVEIDPDYAPAYSMIAQSYLFERHFGFTDDPENCVTQIGVYADLALKLQPNLGHAHSMKGGFLLESGDLRGALQAGLQALRLAPNDPIVRITLARFFIDNGHPAEAEQHMRTAMQLNPFFPPLYFGVLANSLELQGKDDEAIDVLRKAVSQAPTYFSGHLRLASLLGLAGKTEEAGRLAERAKTLNPRFNWNSLEAYYRAADKTAFERFVKGLRAAGITFEN